ncbi:MAG: ribonuclease HII [Caldilineales bacterium]|nr:ribonuclease HII [Caldilineales bacterium]MCW5857853.1 ribonuclease HII [Caldilineales bacterium]
MMIEQELWAQGRRVVGLDEAGRGAWAGPVVAAAVVLPPEPDRLAVELAGVADSKLVRPAVREKLDAAIRAIAEVGVGAVSAAEIDDIGIVPATLRAMELALADLPHPPDYLLIDYIPRPLGNWPQQRLVRGESQSLSIAAASIVAKVHRDRLMLAFHRTYPGYRFDQHKGYGVPLHRAAIELWGPTPIHRRTWAPFVQLRLALPLVVD